MARLALKLKASKPNKFKVREYNRCPLCGRSRAYMRKFDMCRLCFRQMANQGHIPGITKSSW